MQQPMRQPPSDEPVFLTRVEGQLVAAGQPACYSELPPSEGEAAWALPSDPAGYSELPPSENESAWAFPGDPGWAAHGAAQQEAWFPELLDSVGDPSMHMTAPWLPDTAYLGGRVPAEAWSTQGSTAPKRRRPRLHQGFPSGPVPLRRACRNKREKMDAYVEEVAAELRADPLADISQVNVPEVIFNTPYLQKHSFMAVRELLKGCGRSILDADFLLPASFTAGRRRGSIAGSSHASQGPMVPYDPMMML